MEQARFAADAASRVANALYASLFLIDSAYSGTDVFTEAVADQVRERDRVALIDDHTAVLAVGCTGCAAEDIAERLRTALIARFGVSVVVGHASTDDCGRNLHEMIRLCEAQMAQERGRLSNAS
jgi:hypothetical protein